MTDEGRQPLLNRWAVVIPMVLGVVTLIVMIYLERSGDGGVSSDSSSVGSDQAVTESATEPRTADSGTLAADTVPTVSQPQETPPVTTTTAVLVTTTVSQPRLCNGNVFLEPAAAPPESQATRDEEACPMWTGDLTLAGEIDEFVLDLEAGARASVNSHTVSYTGAKVDVVGPSGSMVMTRKLGDDDQFFFDAIDGTGPYALRISASVTDWEYTMQFADVSLPNTTEPVAPVADTCQQPFLVPKETPVEAVEARIDDDLCPRWHGELALAGEIDEFVLDLEAGARASVNSHTVSYTGAKVDVVGPSGSMVMTRKLGDDDQFFFDAIDGTGPYALRISASVTDWEYTFAFFAI